MTVYHWEMPRAGDLSRLSLQTRVSKQITEEQVRIEVRSCGLNFADIFACLGLYSATPEGAFTPGLEVAGVVSEVGHKVTDWKVGDRVMAVTRFGGYASEVVIHPDYMFALPERWSFSEGAAFIAQSMTAWYALTELGRVKPNDNVLIHSAAGGVGLQAMRISKALGANPIGTVSSNRKVDFLAEEGFSDVLVRQKERQFATQLNDQLAGRKLDLVLDGIGGSIQKASFDALGSMGRLVVFGAAEFMQPGSKTAWLRAAWRYLVRPRYDVMDMISDNKSVMAFNLIWLWEQIDIFRTEFDALMALELEPQKVGHTLPFEQAPRALELLQSGQTIGKVVLEVSPERSE